jgi:hypothetical protein
MHASEFDPKQCCVADRAFAGKPRTNIGAYPPVGARLAREDGLTVDIVISPTA